MSDGGVQASDSLCVEVLLSGSLRDGEGVHVVPEYFKKGEERDLSTFQYAVCPDRAPSPWTGWAGPAKSIAVVFSRNVRNVHAVSAT